MATLRVESDVVAKWRETLSAHRGIRGVDPVLAQVLEALTKEGADGHVPLERHHVFSWAEQLRGAAARADPNASQALTRVADDMRSFMIGRLEQQAAPAAPPPIVVDDRAVPPAFMPPPVVTPAFAPGNAPPVQYVRPGAAPAAGQGAPPGPLRLVTEREIGAETIRLVREARSELLVVSPWLAGLDTLVKEILALPPGVQVKILSRRPPHDDPEYHRALVDMRRRAFDVVVSPYIHTRMVLKDANAMLLGAASAPGPQLGSRELALSTTDVAAVGAAREAFLRMLEEARGRS